MANTQQTKPRYEYVTVTEGPPADGSWCNGVNMTGHKTDELFFSRRGGGSATISIQFKTGESGAAWTDYLTDVDLSDGARCILDDHGAGVRWRAGVKENGWSSGTVIVGFDW